MEASFALNFLKFHLELLVISAAEPVELGGGVVLCLLLHGLAAGSAFDSIVICIAHLVIISLILLLWKFTVTDYAA